MLNITAVFRIISNDNITLQPGKGEKLHALLGENGPANQPLWSVLFGLYQPEEGEIHNFGCKVEIRILR